MHPAAPPHAFSHIHCPDSFSHYGLFKAKTFPWSFFLDSWRAGHSKRARRRERRLSWRRLGSVVYSCWKQSQAQAYLLSTDVNTYVFVQLVSLLHWNLILLVTCLSWLKALQQLGLKRRRCLRVAYNGFVLINQYLFVFQKKCK